MIKLPQTLVELAMGKGDIRSYLHHVHVDIPKNKKQRAQLVATNGHFLIAAPMERADADELGAGYLSTDILKQARKHQGELIAKGDLLGAGGMFLERPSVISAGTFPNWRKIVPKKLARAQLADFCVNAEYLAIAQRALTHGRKFAGINVWLPRDAKGTAVRDRALLVTAIGDTSGAFALVMPMTGDKLPASAYVADELARSEE